MSRGACRAFAALVCLIMLSFFSGCSGTVERLAVLEGNAAFARGERQRAVAAYLRAGPGPVRDYNLGNAYERLSERDAALALLDAVGIEPGAEAAVAADALYNAGLVLLDAERYDEAIGRLRASLRLAPSRLDAIRALELATEAARTEKARSSSVRSPTGADERAAARELLSVLKELETERFRPSSPSSSGPVPDDH